ncbi:MAG TPA: P-II family nitrogen regulator, partial [Gemmataceae bacterium]|nr:P-II family nitrogen regulator [Gemmataceae bacterium]
EAGRGEPDKPMKQLTIIVKPFRAEAVLQAIADLGVFDCVVREAKGYSRQKGYLERYIGSEYSLAFLPKVEIMVWADDGRFAELAERIVAVARTGRIGDGKVFAVPTAWPRVLEF